MIRMALAAGQSVMHQAWTELAQSYPKGRLKMTQTAEVSRSD